MCSEWSVVHVAAVCCGESLVGLCLRVEFVSGVCLGGNNLLMSRFGLVYCGVCFV